jgi:uncharacterized protein YggL (DUF469 family)
VAPVQKSKPTLGLGFLVLVTFKHQLKDDELLIFMIAFLAEVIEPQNLAFDGSAYGGYIVSVKHDSATEEHRKSVSLWLSQRIEVSSFILGSLQAGLS